MAGGQMLQKRKRNLDGSESFHLSKIIKSEEHDRGTHRDNAAVEERKTSSRLLSLPGELHNAIYRCILDDEAYEEDRVSGHSEGLTHRDGLTFYPDFGCLTRHPLRRHLTAPAYARCDGTSLLYFGLTQVCRTIRKEFRPLWIIERRINVPMRFINDYLKIHPLASVRNGPRLGTIHLTGGPSLWEKPVDLLALLKASVGHFKIAAEKETWISDLANHQSLWQSLIKKGHLVSLTLHKQMAMPPKTYWRTHGENFVLVDVGYEMGMLCGNKSSNCENWPEELRQLLMLIGVSHIYYRSDAWTCYYGRNREYRYYYREVEG